MSKSPVAGPARRLFFYVLVLALGIGPHAASAADPAAFPTHPVRLVIPFPAGGPLDAVGRAIAQKLGDAWGQSVVVDNRPGAGGNIGADLVAKSAPDGYTVVMGALSTHAVNPSLYPSMPYDAVKDFAPITLVAITPNVLVVNPSLPVHSVQELIAYAKAHPGKLSFGSGSNGSAGHLAGELFKVDAGVDMVHVPYRGAAPAMQALLAGDTQLMFDNLASAMPQVRAGKLRALAVTTAKRSPLVPELPTMAEAGLKDFDIATWFGLRRAGRHAAARDREMECRGLADPRGARHARAARAAGRGSCADDAGAIRALHRSRGAEVRAHREGLGREGRLSRAD
jgi:tripartite-type tricarboxylate transporter receptor subunit TctC